jgi:hypothetical protein
MPGRLALFRLADRLKRGPRTGVAACLDGWLTMAPSPGLLIKETNE